MGIENSKLNKPGIAQSSQKYAVKNNKIVLKNGNTNAFSINASNNITGMTRSSTFANSNSAAAYKNSYGIFATRTNDPRRGSFDYSGIRAQYNQTQGWDMVAMRDAERWAAKMSNRNNHGSCDSMNKYAAASMILGGLTSIADAVGVGKSAGTSSSGKPGTGNFETASTVDYSSATGLSNALKSASTSADAKKVATESGKAIDKIKQQVENTSLKADLDNIENIGTLPDLISEFGLDANINPDKIKDLKGDEITPENLKTQAKEAKTTDEAASKGVSTLEKAIVNNNKLIGVLENKLSVLESADPRDETAIQKCKDQIAELKAKNEKAEAGIKTLTELSTQCKSAAATLATQAADLETLEKTKAKAEEQEIKLTKEEDEKLKKVNTQMKALVSKLENAIGKEKTRDKFDREDKKYAKDFAKLKSLSSQQNNLLDLVSTNVSAGTISSTNLDSGKTIKARVDNILNKSAADGLDVDVDKYNRMVDNFIDSPVDNDEKDQLAAQLA